MQVRQLITLTAMTTLVAAPLVGCGSRTPSSSGAGKPQSAAQAAFAFSRCMRDHGVSNFPDPQVSTNGGATSISQVAPASTVSSPAFRTAQKACAYLQPGPQRTSSSSHGPGKAALLAFAGCLRGHGLAGFPDPTAQGQLTFPMIEQAGIAVHSPGFLSAARACVGTTHGAITLEQIVAAIHHAP